MAVSLTLINHFYFTPQKTTAELNHNVRLIKIILKSLINAITLQFHQINNKIFIKQSHTKQIDKGNNAYQADIAHTCHSIFVSLYDEKGNVIKEKRLSRTTLHIDMSHYQHGFFIPYDKNIFAATTPFFPIFIKKVLAFIREDERRGHYEDMWLFEPQRQG